MIIDCTHWHFRFHYEGFLLAMVPKSSINVHLLWFSAVVSQCSGISCFVFWCLNIISVVLSLNIQFHHIYHCLWHSFAVFQCFVVCHSLYVILDFRPYVCFYGLHISVARSLTRTSSQFHNQQMNCGLIYFSQHAKSSSHSLSLHLHGWITNILYSWMQPYNYFVTVGYNNKGLPRAVISTQFINSLATSYRTSH